MIDTLLRRAYDTTIEQKMNHPCVGVYLCCLNTSVQREEHYKSVLKTTNQCMSSQDERQQMTATVGYLESGQDRFVHNTTPISYQQFLKRSNHHCYNTPINWSTVHFVLDRRSTELHSL